MMQLLNHLRTAKIGILWLCLCLPILAEDTEIYQLSNNATSVTRAKVLIIFDDSGSMATMVTEQSNPLDRATISRRTRMDIAKDVVTSLIKKNPSVDFGLMSFNNNSSSRYDGGRVIHRIVQGTTTAQQNNLLSIIKNLNPNSYTPLCETTYEAYRYLSGSSVLYAYEQSAIDTPDRDILAEAAGQYIAPASDCAYTYLILLTDGEPFLDTDANSSIESLTGKTCDKYRDYRGSNTKNCLPEIAEYMANTDLDGNTNNGNQFVITYTIGFTSQQTLLADTAAKGKGQYFTADSAASLSKAFQSAISSILTTTQSFTSPTTSVDAFQRTESQKQVFFSLFEPSNNLNWPGNIKKLNMSISNGQAVLTDANGKIAFDNTSGKIADTAQTFWSTNQDGNNVKKGGVGALLAQREPSSRNIFSNTGSAGTLEVFDSAHIVPSAFPKLSNDTALFNFFGVKDQAALTKTINWARGMDVDDRDKDGSTTDPLSWILADILHSKPIVVSYRSIGNSSSANPDQRLIVGTNGGFLHMFGTDDGIEDWAFFPKELAPLLLKRKFNALSSQHLYGIDAPPALYITDGGDGIVDASAGDKAYIYFGLRRGGRILYGLDISDPDAPSFLWKIDNNSQGFSELGQTWSVPLITKIPGYVDQQGNPMPVLVFAAGYDSNKDATTFGSDDSMGRGIFIVNALTGSLIWSVSPAVNSATNLQEIGLIHSIPSTITAVDSNGDNLADRFYFGDTGGNVWRIDLAGNTLADAQQNNWFITKIAALNGGTLATDRRFFSPPDLVRSKGMICSEVNNGICTGTVNIRNFDAILIGSGDRTNPNATDVSNQFYMIRDLQLYPYTIGKPSPTDCMIGSNDFRCQLPFSINDLYDVTDNLIQTGTTGISGTLSSASKKLQNANGWRLDLSNVGEKSLSKAITLDGNVFFTTYTPNDKTNICIPLPGSGRLYQLSLQDASARRDANNDGIYDRNDRTIQLGSLIPDSPATHFGSDRKIRLLFPSGGGLLSGNPVDSGATMPQPYGIYWYRNEQ